MCAAAARATRLGRTRQAGERDMRRQLGGQRWANATDLLQTLQRAVSTGRITVCDDAFGERRTDSGQGLQRSRARPIHVDECRRADRRDCRAPTDARGRTPDRRRRLAWRFHGFGPWLAAPPAPGRDRRVHGGDLPGEGHARLDGDRGWSQRPAPAQADAERRNRRHEEQGAAFGGGRHLQRVPPPPRVNASRRRGRHHIPRKTARATSPTTCSVARDTLSAVSSSVWW